MNSSNDKSTFSLVIFVICAAFTLLGLFFLVRNVILDSEAMMSLTIYSRGKITLTYVYLAISLVCLLMLMKCAGSFLMYCKKRWGFILYAIPNVLFFAVLVYMMAYGFVSLEMILFSSVTFLMIILHTVSLFLLKSKQK